jgi:hypothetical protein
MLAYILLTLFIFICSCLDLVDIGNKLQSALFAVTTIILTLFLGTRSVGPDLWTYESMFNSIPILPILLKEFPLYTAITKFEPLYLLLNGLAKWIGISFNTFILLFTAAFCGLFFYRLHCYTKYKVIALMAFLAYGYISGFSAIRQVMAASIFFFSLKYLIEGKRIKYAIFILLACLFHTSAFILLIFCFTGKKQFGTFTIITIVTILVLIVYSGILGIVARTILLRIPFLSAEKVELYLHGEGSFLGTVSIVWIITLITSLLWRDKLEQLDANFNLYLNILWIGLAIYSISVGFGEFGRVLMYFKLVYVILLPLYVSLFKEMKSKLLMTILVGVLSAVFFFAAILSDTQYSSTNRYLPYKSWLFND